jgi:hypothetical protein
LLEPLEQLTLKYSVEIQIQRSLQAAQKPEPEGRTTTVLKLTEYLLLTEASIQVFEVLNAARSEQLDGEF